MLWATQPWEIIPGIILYGVKLVGYAASMTDVWPQKSSKQKKKKKKQKDPRYTVYPVEGGLKQTWS